MDTKAYEQTEAALGEYERPEQPDWSTTPALARGAQPADLIPAGRWPSE